MSTSSSVADVSSRGEDTAPPVLLRTLAGAASRDRLAVAAAAAAGSEVLEKRDRALLLWLGLDVREDGCRSEPGMARGFICGKLPYMVGGPSRLVGDEPDPT